jgi:hypothetical protein
MYLTVYLDLTDAEIKSMGSIIYKTHYSAKASLRAQYSIILTFQSL